MLTGVVECNRPEADTGDSRQDERRKFLHIYILGTVRFSGAKNFLANGVRWSCVQGTCMVLFNAELLVLP